MAAEETPAGLLPEFVRRAVADEVRRAAVATLGALGTAADADFDALTGLAASRLKAPVALITLVDVDRQWFRSRQGVEINETPVEISFCAHAISTGDEIMVVPDATVDARFATNPLVTGEEHVRFYAGAPINFAGERIGTLCVLDRVPRARPDEAELQDLKRLAALAGSLFTLKENTRTGLLVRKQLIREEKRRGVAMAAAALSSWAWDLRTRRAECDQTLPVLFGLPPASQMTLRTLFQAIDRRDVRLTQKNFRDAISGSDDYLGEYRVRGFDPPRWLAARGRVVERDAKGRPLMVLGVNYDITERKLAEARQRLLLRELNHRVKNTLATVQALASQTVRHASDPNQFLAAFSARLQALGSAHSLLSDSEWRGIALRELVRIEVSPFDDRAAPRIHISGPDIHLSPDQALGLALALHELASNAMKFGSLSASTGRVDLVWTLEANGEERWLELTWNEAGGPTVEHPSHKGFGSILIQRSLAKVLASEVRHEFRPGGVYARIAVPLEESASV